MILPLGVCIASLAGFCGLPDELDDVCDGLEYCDPVMDILCMLMADAGRAKGFGETRPLVAALGSGVRVREEGC